MTTQNMQIGECEWCSRRRKPCSRRQVNGRCGIIVGRETLRSRVRNYMTPGTVRVYRLVDPRTGKTRYIGSTRQGLTQRLAQHVSSAAHPSHEARARGPRETWIRGLLDAGLRPHIEEVATFGSHAEAEREEMRLIGTLPDLTNVQVRTLGAIDRPLYGPHTRGINSGVSVYDNSGEDTP